MPSYESLYPASYRDSRQRFVRQVEEGPWELKSFPMPEDALLATDVAISEASDRPLLVLSSGLHGVEGFFGSAVQQAFLSSQMDLLDKCRVVLIHALNPWGFENLRRVNEDNVDLNRNFMSQGDDYGGSDRIYDRLDSLLNPKGRSLIECYHLRAAYSLIRYGGRAITHAFVAGQYDYPEGIYYGGARACWLNRLLHENIDQWVGDSQQIIHLDFHTGLGVYGGYINMMEPGCEPETYAYAKDVFANHYLRLPRGTEKAYQARGNIGTWLHQRFSGRRYMYFCSEFGTYAGVKMLAGLREENRAFHLEGLHSDAHQRASRRLADLFVPRSPKWRNKTIEGALDVIAHSADLLAKSNPG